MNKEDRVCVDDVEGVDRVDRCGAEEADRVEEVADDVFLRKPAILTAVVEGGVLLVEELLPWV